MKDTIEWRRSHGGSNGPNTLLMVRADYVGHLYEDASDGVNVSQVLEDIEVRKNIERDFEDGAIDKARYLMEMRIMDDGERQLNARIPRA